MLQDYGYIYSFILIYLLRAQQTGREHSQSKANLEKYQTGREQLSQSGADQEKYLSVRSIIQGENNHRANAIQTVSDRKNSPAAVCRLAKKNQHAENNAFTFFLRPAHTNACKSGCICALAPGDGCKLLRWCESLRAYELPESFSPCMRSLLRTCELLCKRKF